MSTPQNEPASPTPKTKLSDLSGEYQAVLRERERCAKIAERGACLIDQSTCINLWCAERRRIAAAIRRGE